MIAGEIDRSREELNGVQLGVRASSRPRFPQPLTELPAEAVPLPAPAAAMMAAGQGMLIGSAFTGNAIFNKIHTHYQD